VLTVVEDDRRFVAAAAPSQEQNAGRKGSPRSPPHGVITVG
jgi:hypothetical protein